MIPELRSDLVSFFFFNNRAFAIASAAFLGWKFVAYSHCHHFHLLIFFPGGSHSCIIVFTILPDHNQARASRKLKVVASIFFGIALIKTSIRLCLLDPRSVFVILKQFANPE